MRNANNEPTNAGSFRILSYVCTAPRASSIPENFAAFSVLMGGSRFGVPAKADSGIRILIHATCLLPRLGGRLRSLDCPKPVQVHDLALADQPSVSKHLRRAGRGLSVSAEPQRYRCSLYVLRHRHGKRSSILLWGWPAMIECLDDVGDGVHVVELAGGNDRLKQSRLLAPIS